MDEGKEVVGCWVFAGTSTKHFQRDWRIFLHQKLDERESVEKKKKKNRDKVCQHELRLHLYNNTLGSVLCCVLGVHCVCCIYTTS